MNNGQTCAATSRLLVPKAELAEVEERLRSLVEAMVVGDPLEPATDLGPVASSAQQQSILRYLDKAADEGTVITGGPGPVEGLEDGYFVRPTVVSRLERDSALAREEVFGPVLSVLAYDDVDQAVELANDSDYGLSGAVWSGRRGNVRRRCAAAADRSGVGQRRPVQRQRAVRRFQEVRHRPRAGPARSGRVLRADGTAAARRQWRRKPSGPSRRRPYDASPCWPFSRQAQTRPRSYARHCSGSWTSPGASLVRSCSRSTRRSTGRACSWSSNAT